METDSSSVMDLLEALEDLLDNAKTAPFRSKVLVDRDAIYDLINDIRLYMPNEIKRSKWVVDERNKILVDAKEQAENIKKDAEVRIAKLVAENEITKRANEKAEQIVEDTEKICAELRMSAMEYVDTLLKDVFTLFEKAHEEVKAQNTIIEQCYKEKMEEIHENRRELRETSKQ